ncbi:hypothetical protein VITU102760_01515 [Vibrio tubiashii]|jgi:hypothetical protein|uniref:Uncharacterized protein n=1 Tax=Vibrio tubiashii ATCC 19109 TaxID=1051646 RepID=F9T9N0_9VIBR|nr:hypothetical protein [Vibrio tubiashii]AIW15623.1 hypothetical protein IX91_16115 [Vibrio tubiashii ATCC 19109]EGU51203.1 hypothetical protein VITU9109_10977 [Vibrio tubiashii ATCC 19109]EIF02596.1 hypothetical protein VT1337_17705 [Vibrio tubiashii NCIMB 1337 = ATCC 19106]
MKKYTLGATLLSIMTFPSFADEAIDPSDLTNVYTQAAIFVSSDADIRLTTMFTGAWNESISYAGFVEGNFGNTDADKGNQFGTDYLGGRAQYFQVHEFNNTIMPKVGFSTDLIHLKHSGLDDTGLLSVGAIGLINPAYTPGMMVFPNAAYTTGEVFGESADGYMLNLFGTVPVGNSGAFIQFWPEYFSVSGDEVEMTSKSFNFLLNAPTSTDRRQWFISKLQYNTTDVTLPGGHQLEGDPELKAEVGIKWYF